MRTGDLLACNNRLGIYTFGSKYRQIVDQGIIEATGVSAVIYLATKAHPGAYYDLISPDSCMIYGGRSDVNFVHTSQPRTPVHLVFYNGLSCAIIASDDLMERSFRVISNS